MTNNQQTIVAIATPPGRGGVGIIRVSGNEVNNIAQQILGFLPSPRLATYTKFLSVDKEVIDVGLAIRFVAPNSFTGEDIIEFQGHGGPFILDELVKRILACGARMALPGEFSQRAFLNGKIDLTQAEAIADLINASSHQAYRSAMRSLQGEFSQKIHNFQQELTKLRILVEAAIDFPEEEIDFIHNGKLAADLQQLITNLNLVLKQAQQGSILREGLSVVLAGHPNAGKSTLLNHLAGKDLAIVTDIAGTTRDVMREVIQIDGIPLQFIDTAGLRDSDDIIELEGIRRAWEAINNADVVLLIVDVADVGQLNQVKQKLLQNIPPNIPLVVVVNKIDKLATLPQTDDNIIYISAKTGHGIDSLRTYLKQIVGYDQHLAEGCFMARRRHLDALLRTLELLNISDNLLRSHQAIELLAEDLRQAQLNLSEITGELTADDLLGKIFSSFCIGK